MYLRDAARRAERANRRVDGGPSGPKIADAPASQHDLSAMSGDAFAASAGQLLDAGFDLG